jgi:hypothetical protein
MQTSLSYKNVLRLHISYCDREEGRIMASCLGTRICVHAVHEDGTGSNSMAVYVVTALNNIPNMSHRKGKKRDIHSSQDAL